MTPTIQTLTVKNWIVRLSVPETIEHSPVMLLLHGWTGDENVMWIFTSRLSAHYVLIAPRGIYRTPEGGYGWHKHIPYFWPEIADFVPAVYALREVLRPEYFPGIDFSRLYLMGFSQGAALTYSFALLFPELVSSFAGLSGFLPKGIDTFIPSQPLRKKTGFIAHGSKDTLVPVERARQSVDILMSAGAKITYCEDDVGHKLSANCFRGMEAFFMKDIAG